MKNKICFIIPYFGEFPSYFDLFLKSCKYNKDFDWLIFTDNTGNYEYPKNVKKIELTFEECKHIIQGKFKEFAISLDTPKKFCDYKPAYGYIFEEYLNGYEFWGYCDIDLIFGDLKKFITDDILNKYDRLFSLGHLSLYRNNKDINTMFMRKINNEYRYKQVYQCKQMCVFDEWSKHSVNYIFLENGINIYSTDIIADIAPYNYSFKITSFDIDMIKWFNDNIKNSIFKWDKGKIIRIWDDTGNVIEKEYMYIHIQKRNMINKIKNKKIDSFYIVPNKFIQFNKEQELYNLRKYKLKTIFDYKKVNKDIQRINEDIKIKIKQLLNLKPYKA